MSTAVIYGSTTGMTEAVAQKIAAELGCTAVNVNAASAADFDADLLVLGSSTWGVGDLQDDWAASGLALLQSLDLAGKKVAVFGLGDGAGFADSFCDAVATLVQEATARGATNVGTVSAADYAGVSSKVVEGGSLVGLALDDTNEADKTDARVAAWVAQLKAC